jgi:hypothetical protein
MLLRLLEAAAPHLDTPSVLLPLVVAVQWAPGSRLPPGAAQAAITALTLREVGVYAELSCAAHPMLRMLLPVAALTLTSMPVWVFHCRACCRLGGALGVHVGALRWLAQGIEGPMKDLRHAPRLLGHL